MLALQPALGRRRTLAARVRYILLGTFCAIPVLAVVALAHQLGGDESRFLVAQKIVVCDRQLRMIRVKAHLDEVLAAGSAKNRGAHRAAALASVGAVGGERAARRIHAKSDVVHAVKEGMQLGPQDWRFGIITKA